jgi:cysteinyl-tRNA synthetase
MRIFNSLSKKVEEFEPLNSPHVGMYTCGPTVYNYPTIGNYRTYTLADTVVRTLQYSGFEVKYVMNLTDVGHLTGDNAGDADTGEDRLEKAAKREGKTAWDVAEFYAKDFLESFEKLNLIHPVIAKATDHIQEQIELIQKLEVNGFTYQIDDGIYFDVLSYEKDGHDYSKLTTLDKIKAGARVEVNLQKKDPRDFALWKFSPIDSKREMEWDSPWGKGFPGWHIECSAMSMEYLGEQFDLHLGGEDLRSTHHPNEIAQSEGATGCEPFVKYWMHGAFLTVDGGRMGKSLGNAYTLHDLSERSFDPLDLRYFYLTGHYRKQINFTWEALTSAKTARLKLTQHMQEFKNAGERTELSDEKLEKVNTLRVQFKSALDDDLNLPQALAVVWEVVKSNVPDYDKYDLLMTFDEVLGLRLTEQKETLVSDEIQELIDKREELRREGRYEEADKLRNTLTELGFTVKDK